jgi:hypothetical protein
MDMEITLPINIYLVCSFWLNVSIGGFGNGEISRENLLAKGCDIFVNTWFL